MVPIAPGTGEISPATVADHVDGDTAAVVFIHASNVLGTRVDAQAVAAAVHGRNPEPLVLVDGPQPAPDRGVPDFSDQEGMAAGRTLLRPGPPSALLSNEASLTISPFGVFNVG